MTYFPRNISQVCFIKIDSIYWVHTNPSIVLNVLFMLTTKLYKRCYYYSNFIGKEPILRRLRNLVNNPRIWIQVLESRTDTLYHCTAYSHNASEEKNVSCFFNKLGGSSMVFTFHQYKKWLLETNAWYNVLSFPKDFYPALRLRVQNLTRRCEIHLFVLLKLFPVKMVLVDLLIPQVLCASTNGSQLQTSLGDSPSAHNQNLSLILKF